MKKDGIALLIADRATKKAGGKDEPEYDGDDLEVAAEDILDAVKEKDASALVDALKAFIELCE